MDLRSRAVAVEEVAEAHFIEDGSAAAGATGGVATAVGLGVGEEVGRSEVGIREEEEAEGEPLDWAAAEIEEMVDAGTRLWYEMCVYEREELFKA